MDLGGYLRYFLYISHSMATRATLKLQGSSAAPCLTGWKLQA